MKRTTFEMFRDELVRTGSYVTPPERRAAKPRKPSAWTTFWFSWSTFGVFPKCSIAEARRILNQDLWAKVCFKSISVCEKFGGTMRIEGFKDRAEYKGNVVYVSNHMSTLETILLPACMVPFAPLNIIVKASLTKLPLCSKCACHMGLLPVTRTDPRKDLETVFSDGVARIKAGGDFLIFPQGTRQSEWIPKKFSSIGAKLAEKAGVKLVPIAVKTDILPTRGKKGIFKDFGTVDPAKEVRVSAGPVISGSAKEMHQKSVEWIGAKLAEWGMA